MSRGQGRPPGHRVFDAEPLTRWLREHYAGRETRTLAQTCGVGETTIYRLRSGRTDLVRETTADRIVTALDGTLSEVFDGEPGFQHDASTAIA